jgi:pimeloyl-ACP methyl ester carboxylesterase
MSLRSFRIALVAVACVPAAIAVDARADATSPTAQLMRPRDGDLDRPLHTRAWPIRYVAHDGRSRFAYILLPRWHGPSRHPVIPLVISPHGRGRTGLSNLKLWGDLPGLGGFAVVNPDGEASRLGAYSWGAPGQIDDLAKMPAIVRRTLPWLRIDARRVYAVGGSMGGQEALLLLAGHPRLLAGVAAFDAVVDFAHQYREFPRLACSSSCRAQLGTSLGSVVQELARLEVGGDPSSVPAAYAERSPLAFARELAASCVPLELWWSSRDRIVVDPERQGRRLLAELRRLNPAAPVDAVEGTWVHSAEMRASTRLPYMLARFGLVPTAFGGSWALAGARVVPPPVGGCVRPD